MDRIFSVGQLYKEFEKQWTPSALSFAQASWDVSVNEALHRIGSLNYEIFFWNICEYFYNLEFQLLIFQNSLSNIV